MLEQESSEIRISWALQFQFKQFAKCHLHRRYNSNVHRGVHHLSAQATKAYEEARAKLAKFINAKSDRDVIFTKNASEALNLVAFSWGLSNLGPGDEVSLTWRFSLRWLSLLLNVHCSYVPIVSFLYSKLELAFRLHPQGLAFRHHRACLWWQARRNYEQKFRCRSLIFFIGITIWRLVSF